MRITLWLSCLACLGLIQAGCYTPPPPAVAIQAPAPSVALEAPSAPPTIPPPTGYVAYAPDYYVWDGNEYVGVSNGQYVYWTGGTWIAAPSEIVVRFHGWERYHRDWHRHAIPYRRHFR
ncbi:MAG TPA: hypothetical protein VL793_08750 [Patescibacteria group bacterium]|jgi:hypothetical protein|nr:hypothetical protein [Patescibacteria group bacterium]